MYNFIIFLQQSLHMYMISETENSHNYLITLKYAS